MESDLLDNDIKTHGFRKEASIKPVILKWGKIGAIVSIAFSLVSSFLAYTNYLPFETGPLQMIISFLTIASYIVIMSLAVLAFKKSNGGFMSFVQAFQVSYFTGCIMAIVSLVTTIVLFIFAKTFLNGGNNALNEGIFSGLGGLMPLIISSVISTISGFVTGAFIAAIISAITKRDRQKGFDVY